MRLKIKNLEIKFKKKNIFDEINLELAPGIYGLYGLNGSGKSLFLKTVAGQFLPSKGDVLIDEKKVYENTRVMLKTLYLNEQFITILQNYDTPTVYYKKISKYILEFDINKAIEYLNLFKIPFTKTIDKLSLGQKACVIGIVCLATKREVILLDGIYNGMDYHVRKEYNKILLENKTNESIIIIATELKNEIKIITDFELNINNNNIILSRYEAE